jgi:hypothetical protein
MSQRWSEYQRIPLDLYETPSWCVDALIPHLPRFTGRVLEPACGSGKMVRALRLHNFDVIGSDIAQGEDFLQQEPATDIRAVISNPPYDLAQEFIEHALSFDTVRIVAMLLRIDFDSAATRRHLFADCKAFAKKVVLTKRIRWIEGSTGSPSFNHAWFVHDRRHRGPPTIAYAGLPLSVEAADARAAA